MLGKHAMFLLWLLLTEYILGSGQIIRKVIFIRASLALSPHVRQLVILDTNNPKTRIICFHDPHEIHRSLHLLTIQSQQEAVHTLRETFARWLEFPVDKQ